MSADLHHRLRTLLFLVPYVYRHRGVPLAELASRLRMDERELVAEIDFLLMVGRPPFLPNDMIDIYVDAGKVYVDLPQALQRPPRFTVYETLALACAAQLFTGDEMGEAAVAVRVALGKVLDSLPPETRRLFDGLAERYLVLGAGGPGPHLDLLRRAIADRQEVKIRYYAASRDETGERVIQPHGLHFRRGLWYLVAFCTEREDLRVFRLSRVLSAELVDRIFEPEDDLDTGALLDERLELPAEGERVVRLRFSNRIARWVTEHWGPERIEEQPDGSLVATLHEVSDEFVLAYAASFGGEAAIESPESLRRELAAQARRALDGAD
ncbi:MAG: WYL domain-containing protein [Deltaproteobacteria bacterium]|nr:WYL domain-containing protein [Deltaproteobacteria bacterium]